MAHDEAAVAVADPEAGHEEHAAHDEHAAGGHHRGGKGHDGGHGGGGHGGSWIVTYCDMITLLIAFFICIMTFASSENGSQDCRKKRDSLLYGEGGTGVMGAAHKGADQDAVVWRQLLLAADLGRTGSRIPPLYSDPALGATGKVLRLLEQPAEATLPDSYALRLPLDLLFASGSKLAPSGEQILGTIARNVRRLPYDLLLQADDPARLPQALALARHLTGREGLAAGRVGVGVRPGGAAGGESVWVLLVRRS